MAENKLIILPDDPEWKQPVIMGDPYNKKLTPKLSAEVNSADYSISSYASSANTYAPEHWVKTAQSSGVNNTMTQPMWFSPLHTPQSWQTPSKRRETYQWCRHFYECFLPENKVLLHDLTEQCIYKIKKGDLVIAGDGSVREVKSVFKRQINEKILHIYVSDKTEPITCTKNHVIPRVGQLSKDNEEVWDSADSLTTDCYLFCPEINDEPKKWKKVVKIEEHNFEGDVYDLEIDAVHSYVVNGCVVHNSEPKVAAAIDFYCFTPTMQVLMKDGTQKPISTVKIGDSVRCHDGTTNKVVNKFKRSANESILKITFAGRHEDYIQCTYGHEILQDIDGEFKFIHASELKVDDYLLTPANYGEEYNQVLTSPDCHRKGDYLYRKILSIECKNYEGTLYDLEIENQHSYIVNYVSVHNSRFPQNGFKLEYPEGTRADAKHLKKILAFYEHHVVKKMKLAERMKEMSSEYFMLGDVFIHCDIKCDICRGTCRDPDSGEECLHPDGMFNRIFIMNPDWIEVQKSPFSDESVIVMVPDEMAQQIVHKRQPKALYDRIPDSIKQLILARQPIPLSPRTTFHLKHMPTPYGSYGTSLIRRLFTTLAYKTKIMTANWIVAERLILPIRVAKVGSDDRPATMADIADVQQQLAATANEPNLVIVVHHNFEMEFIGASGKILQVTQEMEHIDKEILDGMMLNQALLNGEAPSYQGVQVGVETLIRRIEAWRITLAETVEDNVFKPLAEMQGFIDERRSDEVGEAVFLYPRIKWNDLELRDKNPWHQILLQLHDKQVISTQTLCEELELNYDQEVRRMRYEQISVGPAGALDRAGGGDPKGGGGDPSQGGGGGGGGMGGGSEGGVPLGGGAGGGMDMGGGGGMMGGGDMGGGGGGMGGATASAGGKILKKGKAGKQEEQEVEPAAPIKLTTVEQSMRMMLEEICTAMNVNLGNVRMQMPIPNPKGGKPYMLDFAIPHLKINVEPGGQYWHSMPDQKAHDQERDELLAQRGWTVLRFEDEVIEDAPQDVKSTISSYIQKALQHTKKASLNDDTMGVLNFFTVINGELKEIYSDF